MFHDHFTYIANEHARARMAELESSIARRAAVREAGGAARRRSWALTTGAAILTMLTLAANSAPAGAAVTPVDQLPIPAPQAGFPTQCHAYASQVVAFAEYQKVTAGINRLLELRGSLDAQLLFEDYLTHGQMSPIRTIISNPQTYAEFKANPATQAKFADVQKDLQTALQANLPKLQAPTSPVRQTLKSLNVGQGLKINYTPAGGTIGQQTTTPALIAGSTGSVIGQAGIFSDSRAIEGTAALIPTANAKGVTAATHRVN